MQICKGDIPFTNLSVLMISFLQLSEGEKGVFFAGQLLKLREQQDDLTPPETLYMMPKNLQVRFT